MVRPHVWYKLGNGSKASVWFDNWDELCPLINRVTHRAVSNAGFDKQEMVADVVREGAWTWPITWYNSYPTLNQLTVPNLIHDKPDSLMWKYDGVCYDFSVKHAWHSIHDRGVEVDWVYLVWSKYAIPRHTTHLWLVMRKRLITHDRMRQWHVGNDVYLATLRCSLCKTQPDSHEHLFFECPFSLQVWNLVMGEARMTGISPKWSDIVAWLLPISKQNKVATIVGRLILAASSYFVWQERNNRIHGNGTRNPDVVARVILDMVRLKLASIHFKKKVCVEKMKRTWKIANVQLDIG